MPLIATRGAASAQGFGEFASVSEPVYIESCFSTYLYTGNGSTQTITNGIDLAGKGGLVWNKKRSAADNHFLWDTVRPIGSSLSTDLTDAEGPTSTGRIAYSSTGFSWQAGGSGYNQSGQTYASWTFRKQAKFFDIVTYTGNGSNRTISHNLGSVPGCIIVKRTDTAADWQVYHRSLANTEYLVLNSTAAKATGTTRWNSTTPTSTVFSVGTDTTVNANGGTYVAYLFAHNAGGFGASGSDNVISCGSFTTDSSTGFATINLGYEPQFVLYKRTDGIGSWEMLDVMRGWTVDGVLDSYLLANTSDAEASTNLGSPLATGFFAALATSRTYIYIAIRRGPMKTPTSGTSVFSPVVSSSGTNPRTITTNFPVDLSISTTKTGTGKYFTDRLRGGTTTSYAYLDSTNTGAEATGTGAGIGFDNNTAIVDNSFINSSNGVFWSFRRAPGFFDEVCYTGTGSARTVTHNLGVVPELMIVKCRNTAGRPWFVYTASTGNGNELRLNATDALGSSSVWNSTTPTSTVFSLSNGSGVNASGDTYVAYLFASCPGVSKVGSYTGTGTTKQIDCGFTAGARFVMIKRTDSTGDWYVWDSARGIVAGNDPYLLLNSTAAEVTSTDYVDTYNAGFEISSTAPAAINANGGSFIFLAIA